MVRLFFLFVILGVGLASFLFQTSYKVHELEQTKVHLQKAIKAEKETYRLLQAEWMHLNDPERLKALTEKFLQMKPTMNTQIKSLNDIPLKSASSTIEIPLAPASEGTAQ